VPSSIEREEFTCRDLSTIRIANDVTIGQFKALAEARGWSGDWLVEQCKDEMDRHALEWTTNLVMDQEGRVCDCGCGLVYMRRYRTGEHIDPAELIADWQDDEQDERLEDFDLDAVMRAPVEVPLKPAVSQAQVLWARDMLAQFPRKSKAQICQENSGISWAQLEHYAKTPLSGLPERKGQKKPAPKAQVKPTEKPVKQKSTKKVKGA
jgi:hypothetical protein